MATDISQYSSPPSYSPDVVILSQEQIRLINIELPEEILCFRDKRYNIEDYKPKDETQIVITSCYDNQYAIKQFALKNKNADCPIVIFLEDEDKCNIADVLMPYFNGGNITSVEFIRMRYLTDKDLENIFSVEQKNLIKFLIKKCPLITELPDNVYTKKLTHIIITECYSFKEISRVVLFTSLHTLLIISEGMMLNSVVLPDNLWHLNKTLQILEVPKNTIFQQILIDRLKQSLLPYRYQPVKVKNIDEAIIKHNNDKRLNRKMFRAEQKRELKLYGLKADKESKLFIDSLGADYNKYTKNKVFDDSRFYDDCDSS